MSRNSLLLEPPLTGSESRFQLNDKLKSIQNDQISPFMIAMNSRNHLRPDNRSNSQAAGEHKEDSPSQEDPVSPSNDDIRTKITHGSNINNLKFDTNQLEENDNDSESGSQVDLL